MKKLHWYRNRPYFLNKVYWSKESLFIAIQRYKTAHYYYEKVLDTRTGKIGYALYLDAKLAY